MPRAHFPLRGGPQMPSGYTPGASGDAADGCPQCRELAAQVEKLRRELAQRKQAGQSGDGTPRSATGSMMWAALGLCGLGLLFALLALLHHG